MAQVRRLSLVLDLDSGKFSSKITDVTGKVNKFNHAVSASDSSLRKSRSELNLYGNTVGAATKAVWGLQSAVFAITFVFGGFTASLVKTNAEAQRSIIMLQGMSKAVDDLGKKSEAAQNFQWLLQLSKNAPFSLDVLTNGFVKLKSVGIDPTTGSLKAIVDAVAAFGGSSEQMNRAIIGVQQMSGKGVVSMEELRQQLGEAIPTAIQATANAFGISYGKMVKEISKGNVASEPFIKKMMMALDDLYGGSAQKMMNTYSGQVSKLKTNFQQLMMTLGGLNQDGSFQKGGIMDALTASLKDLNKWLSDPDTQAGAVKLGNDIAFLIGKLVDLAKWVGANSDKVKLLLGAFVAFKGAQVGVGIITKMAGAFTKLSGSASTVIKILHLATLAKGGNAAAARLLSMQLQSMSGIMGGVTQNATGLRVAMGLLVRVASMLTPWGLLATAVIAVGTAFAGAAIQAERFRRAKERAMRGEATVEDATGLNKEAEKWREKAEEQEALARSKSRGIDASHHIRMAQTYRRRANELQTGADAAAGRSTAPYANDNEGLRRASDTQRHFQRQGSHAAEFSEPMARLLERMDGAKDAQSRRTMIGAADQSFRDQIAGARTEVERQRITGAYQAFQSQVLSRQKGWDEKDQNRNITFEDTLLENGKGKSKGSGSGSGDGKTGAERLLDVVNRLEARKAGMEVFVDTLDEGERAATEMRERIESGEYEGVTDTLKARAIEAARQNAIAAKDLRRVGEIFKTVRDQAEESGLATEVALEDMADGASAPEAAMNKFARGLARMRNEAIRLDPTLKDDADRLAALDKQIAQIVDNERVKRLAEEMRSLADEADRIRQVEGLGKHGGAWADYLGRSKDFSSRQGEINRTADPVKRAQLQQELDRNRATVTGDLLRKMLEGIAEETEANREAVMTDQQIREKAYRDEVARINAITDTSMLSYQDQLQYAQKFADARAALLLSAQEKLARDSETPMQKMLRDYQDVTERMKDAQSELLGDFMSGMESGNLKFDEFALKIVEKILWIKAQAKAAEWVDGLVNTLGSAMGSIFGGGASVATSGGQWGSNGGLVPGRLQQVGGFHTGGVVGGSATFSRAVSTALFNGATRYHTGGIAGLAPNEVPAILQRGEGVFTREQMAALGGGQGVQIEFNLINESGESLQAEEGGRAFDGEKYIIDVVVSNMGRPGPMRNAVKNVR